MATERGVDPNSLEDLNRIIAEDFGEPSDLGPGPDSRKKLEP